jgi:tRNA A37 threonylcarbamoyladenosine dehydratase
MVVTASFGLVAAAHVLRKLAEQADAAKSPVPTP